MFSTMLLMPLGMMNDNNFYIKNNLAYTEDHVLIFNVFLYKISKKVKLVDIQNHFQQYGCVTKTRLVESKTAAGRRKGSRVGFVNFKEAESAAKVLEIRHHVMKDSKLVSVKACDSWHQPGEANASSPKKMALENLAQNFEVPNTATMDNITSIHDLNDDCLLIIFQTLPLRDQISFACSHSYFTSIFQIYAKSNYKTFDTSLFESLSLWNIRQFFILVGQFIETFTGIFDHKERGRIVNFTKTYCPNVKKIKLDGVMAIKLSCLHKLFSNKPKVKSLHLFRTEVTDNWMFAIKKLQNLENLIITDSYQFTGQHLYLLKSLKNLRLFCCGNLSSSHMHKALEAMPKLEFLDIRGADRLSQDFFKKLPTVCKNLEYLQMSCINVPTEGIANIAKLKSLSIACHPPYELHVKIFRQLAEAKNEKLESLQIMSRSLISLEHCELISKLKKLKKLHMTHNDGVTDDCLSALTDLKELQELKLSGCSKISNYGILNIVRHCPKLNWINLERTSISIDFIKGVSKILKNKPRQNGPIKFLIAGTAIDKLALTQKVNLKDLESVANFQFAFEEPMKSFVELDEDKEDYMFLSLESMLDEYNDYDGVDDLDDIDYADIQDIFGGIDNVDEWDDWYYHYGRYGFESDDDDDDYGLWLHGEAYDDNYW